MADPPGDSPGEDGRTPGWREVLLVAVVVLAVVFGLEVLSTLLPPLRDLFRAFPVTIVVLIAGTVGLLLLVGLRRPRG